MFTENRKKRRYKCHEIPESARENDRNSGLWWQFGLNYSKGQRKLIE